MAMKRQPISNGATIYMNNVLIDKKQIIDISKEWSEPQTLFFKKMLKQGGKFKIMGERFEVELKERHDLDSKGNKPINIPPIPGERTF